MLLVFFLNFSIDKILKIYKWFLSKTSGLNFDNFLKSFGFKSKKNEHSKS